MACRFGLTMVAVVRYNNYMFLMYAEAGNPLLLFEEWFGNHLIGIPVLGAVFIGLMYGILYICRKIVERKAVK